jgi:hypothetical protein
VGVLSVLAKVKNGPTALMGIFSANFIVFNKEKRVVPMLKNEL